MSEILNDSILSKKTEMYAMIISMEADFVANFAPKITLEDVPVQLIERAKKVENETNPLLKVLRGLDIQAYIEICNANILKMSITANQKNFLNQELSKIIPIRNAVMHPRPLGFYDYSMVKTLFENIDTNLSCFSWEHVKSTRIQIKQHPETLIPPPALKKSDRIIENLPTLVDYEETSFIGRSQEIAEIRKQLNRRNVHILSIIGDGGIGKTAITLKLLYDMLDDPQCEYELIIWVSLKTNELSDYEFMEIKNAITSTSEIYDKLKPFVGADDSNNTKDYIIELAQNFNTLFVLDNLETLNTSDVREFIDDFSEYGKVLITSRIGLGEMEHRYKLQGLKESEVLAYADVLLGLYGYECYFTEERKKELFCDILHANPLAIKWFIRCLYNGQTETDILSHKDDLVNFCMANVYDKLSNQAKEVLDILTVAGVALSLPEIIYYLGKDLKASIDVKLAINELGKCNFISEDEFKNRNQVVVTDFAKDFLALHFTKVRDLLPGFKIKEQKLISHGQNLMAAKAMLPFRLLSMIHSNKSELVITYYLCQAIDDLRKDKLSGTPLDTILQCQMLLPQYFECNLALTSVYGASSPLKAEHEYNEAIKHSKNQDELLRSSLLFVDFLIRNSEYLRAYDLLCELQDKSPDCIDVILEKAKVLGCLYKFDEALSELGKLKTIPTSSPLYFKIITKKADIYRRKATRLDPRRTQEKLIILKQGIEVLESQDLSQKIVADHMVDIIRELIYSYQDPESLECAFNIVNLHQRNIRKAPKCKELIEMLDQTMEKSTDPMLTKIKAILDIADLLHLLKPNEIVVTAILDGYGFCRNATEAGIYFSMSGLPQDIGVGDIFTDYNSVRYPNGLRIYNPKRIASIFDRI